MKIGKIPESVLKRSVIKQIHTRREEVILGAGVGEDCTAMRLKPGEVLVMSADPITGTAKDCGMLAVQVTVNDLASSGAEPVGIMLTALLPEDTEEADIKLMMGQVEEACSHFNIQIMGGHTEITGAVTRPVLSVTGVGKVEEGKLVTTAGAKPGQDIVVTKWIGIEGTSIIAKEKEEELLKRFPKNLVETAKGFDRYLSVLEESRVAAAAGVSAMHDVTEGGIYGALWEMAEASGVGLEIDQKSIPIRQETVEICEYFGLNPYCLISSGSMLMAADNGHDLVRALKGAGIEASVIGKAVPGKARRIINGGEESFLGKPQTDELYKI